MRGWRSYAWLFDPQYHNMSSSHSDGHLSIDIEGYLSDLTKQLSPP